MKTNRKKKQKEKSLCSHYFLISIEYIIQQSKLYTIPDPLSVYTLKKAQDIVLMYMERH